MTPSYPACGLAASARLALDRIDVDRPQAAEPQHVHGEPRADPVAVEHADRVASRRR